MTLLSIKRTGPLPAALFASIVLLAAACGSDAATSTETGTTDSTETTEAAAGETTDSTVADDADADATASAGSSLAGIEAAQWSDTIELTVDGDSFRYVSDGLPNHELPDQFLIPNADNMPPFDGDDISAEFTITDTEGLIVASPVDVEITLNPVYSEEVTETSLSTIGVMISGAVLFNDYEDMSRDFVAIDDNLSLDGVYFIDSCNGHPLASGDSYHYHGIPYCITDVVDVADQHSTIIGVLLDGFPVYGEHDEGGVVLTNDDLDECSGHFGPTPEFPDGIYHYHLTADASPYSIDCFHGVIDYGGDQVGGQTGPPPGDEDAAAGGGGAPVGGPPADGGQGGAPDFTEAAVVLGVSVTDLESALGQPPFDLAAAADSLGVTEADLEAAIPAPPG